MISLGLRNVHIGGVLYVTIVKNVAMKLDHLLVTHSVGIKEVWDIYSNSFTEGGVSKRSC